MIPKDIRSSTSSVDLQENVSQHLHLLREESQHQTLVQSCKFLHKAPKLSSIMYLCTLVSLAALLSASATSASVLVERAVVDGPCTGSGGAPGVCITTSKCSSGGGQYISNACPGTPNDIKCCTKTSCGSGGNCRFTSQCSSGNTLTGLCPGPPDFKCCVPSGGSGGPYPTPAFPAVGACKQRSVDGARAVVAANPGQVRQIYCIRDCACPGTSDHCCGLAIDFMCSSAGGVSVPPISLSLSLSLVPLRVSRPDVVLGEDRIRKTYC